jgi:hypothetical protein
MGHEVLEQQPQHSSNCRVEVSGWDASENFFCEKAVLFTDGITHQLCVHAILRKGSVVFVQLLQPFDSDENFPIPYLVAENLSFEMNGRTMVAITRMHPTPSYRQTVTRIDDHRRYVA